MHPFDAASFLSAATPAEGGLEPPQQQEGELFGAASSPSPSDSRGTRAGAGDAGIRCQDCRQRAKAYCAHCCIDRGGFVCPGHVKTPHVPAASQCSERQQTLAASASIAAAVDVEPIPKRPRRTALPSVAAPTATSSVDQPIATTATVPERFAREVSMVAVFRRVRLGGPEPEVAYYTTVAIAGHVFRGVLYDVGPHGGSGSTSTAASDTDGSGEVGSSLSTAGGSCLDLTLGL